MWWIILLSIFGLLLILRFIVFLFGNWRATLNRVISQYIAWKQMEPNYSDAEIFMAVLDHRYPEKAGYFSRMHERKNETKANIVQMTSGYYGDINRFSLPILIYTCLAIEENSYIDPSKSIKDMLDPITNEVKRQGFAKYC